MTRKFHYLFGVFVFAIGTGLGAWFAVERRSDEFTATFHRHLHEDPGANSSGGSLTAHRIVSEEATLAAIMTAVADSDPLRRAHSLRELLANLSSSEFSQIFEHAVALGSRAHREAVLLPLITRWAQIDHAAAAAAVQPYLTRFRRPGGVAWQSTELAIAEAWAKASPESTFGEAMAAARQPWARAMAGYALQSLAAGDPAEQLKVLSGAPASGLRDDLCTAALTSLAEKDFAAAEAQMNLVEDPR